MGGKKKEAPHKRHGGKNRIAEGKDEFFRAECITDNVNECATAEAWH